ncbi:MAG TPA: hypothetical protein VF133_11785 [Terriglobales bacterium]
MDRRRTPRVAVQLPVQVWGLDAFGRPFTQSAMVTNLSSGGIVLQGVRRRMRTGELLDVRMGSTKAEFRVIWISEEGELGMQSLSVQSFLPPAVLTQCAQAAAAC